jgi:lysophospholipase L1-like esterase
MNRKGYILIILLSLAFFRGVSQDVAYSFADEIRQFKESDKSHLPPRNGILFIGSSSFRMWQDAQNDFPGFPIINRGFGGATLIDQMHYAGDIIFPYFPKQIVIYCGENDLANSDTVTPEMVTERFKNLFQLIRSKLPDVKITYVSMKPSPSRWYLAKKMMEGNRSIRGFLDSQANADFVNIWDRMLNENNQPDTTLFLDDRLHMNAKGYKIWQEAIKPALIH